jgi:hypothetical protein
MDRKRAEREWGRGGGRGTRVGGRKGSRGTASCCSRRLWVFAPLYARLDIRSVHLAAPLASPGMAAARRAVLRGLLEDLTIHGLRTARLFAAERSAPVVWLVNRS